MSINYVVLLNTKNPTKAYLMMRRNFEPYVFTNIEEAKQEAKKVSKHFRVVAI